MDLGFLRDEQFWKDYGKTLSGAFSKDGAINDVLKMVGTGAAAEVAGGLGGIQSLAMGRGPDQATRDINTIQDKLTYAPRTETAQGWLQNAAPYVNKGANIANDIAMAIEGSTGIAREAVKAVPQMALELLPSGVALKALNKIPSIKVPRQFKQSGAVSTKAPKKKLTEFEQAHDLAQKRATLPTEEGGLGLPANNTPMDRANAQNYDMDTDLYHASTHDIDSFDMSKASPESDMGASIYTTTNPADASNNYSDLTGADLTQQIDKKAEQLADEMGLDYDDPIVKQKAKEVYYGGSENIMPLYGRSDKPMKVGGNDSTWLNNERPVNAPEDYIDDVKSEGMIERTDYDTKADYDEAVLEAANDMAVEESYNLDAEGEIPDMTESLRYNRYGGDADNAIDGLLQEGMEGMNADDAMDIMRNDEGLMGGYDDAGNMMNHEIIRGAVEDAGFDSIQDSGVYDKWGYGSNNANVMEGIEPDTQHRMFFKPNQLRSRFAAFDPFKKDSKNLLANYAPAGLSGLLGLYLSQQGEARVD